MIYSNIPNPNTIVMFYTNAANAGKFLPIRKFDIFVVNEELFNLVNEELLNLAKLKKR